MRHLHVLRPEGRRHRFSWAWALSAARAFARWLSGRVHARLVRGPQAGVIVTRYLCGVEEHDHVTPMRAVQCQQERGVWWTIVNGSLGEAAEILHPGVIARVHEKHGPSPNHGALVAIAESYVRVCDIRYLKMARAFVRGLVATGQLPPSVVGQGRPSEYLALLS